MIVVACPELRFLFTFAIVDAGFFLRAVALGGEFSFEGSKGEILGI